MSENLAMIKKGLQTVSNHSNKLSNAMDKHTKDVLIHCLYSLAAVKTKLGLKHDPQLEKVLSSFGLDTLVSDLEVWPIVLFLATGVFCLGCSTIFHWFHPKNENISKILNRIDLAGISILIYGSSVCGLYYLFYCKPTIFWIYFAILTASCGSIFGISMMDWFYLAKYNALRTYVYIILGIFSAIGMVHAIISK